MAGRRSLENTVIKNTPLSRTRQCGALEGGEWGVGSAPHSLGGKVRVFIPQGKTCPIFLSMLPNKTFMLRLFKKNLSLKSQAEGK